MMYVLKNLDEESRAIIIAYINRISVGGSLKNLKYISDGVQELKINFGPGFRVYFGRPEVSTILLLIGGEHMYRSHSYDQMFSKDIRKPKFAKVCIKIF